MIRTYHPWEKWECFRAGLYESAPLKWMTAEESVAAYAEFLRNTPRFTDALKRVLAEWPHSCAQFLSNENINRIAWLGQAAMCIDTGVPREFRAGFKLLNEEERSTANATAAVALADWLNSRLYA